MLIATHADTTLMGIITGNFNRDQYYYCTQQGLLTNDSTKEKKRKLHTRYT